jgi:hypothetical protein
MKLTMTGNMLMKSVHRMAGTYQIAYDVETPSGKKGTALFVYEYDKRDVMEETVMTTPEIAEEVRAYIGDDSPSCFGTFAFPDTEEENKNTEKVTAAVEACTEQAYGWDG